MNKEIKENLEEWISILVGLFGSVAIIVLMLSWAFWLANIFLYPQLAAI